MGSSQSPLRRSPLLEATLEASRAHLLALGEPCLSPEATSKTLSRTPPPKASGTESHPSDQEDGIGNDPTPELSSMTRRLSFAWQAEAPHVWEVGKFLQSLLRADLGDENPKKTGFVLHAAVGDLDWGPANEKSTTVSGGACPIHACTSLVSYQLRRMT